VAADGPEIRVLVVDDEEDFATSLVARLSRRGFLADWAPSGGDALAALEQRTYEVVILDLKMPGMSGLEALRVIRSRWPAVQAIVLTGHGDVESGIEGMKTGAADYLRKPIPIDDLCIAIRAAAEKGRHRES
jgi:DNA-binding response OmpR family regulator